MYKPDNCRKYMNVLWTPYYIDRFQVPWARTIARDLWLMNSVSNTVSNRGIA